MNYERSVEVYFNQFTNLVEGEDGLCKGYHHEGVKAALKQESET